MPSKNHALIQTRLGTILSRSPDYEAASEMTIDIGSGTPLTPDLSIVKRMPLDLWNDIPRVSEPPITTVEIISASQSPEEMVRKIHTYLRHGVQSCWLVNPPMQNITIFTQGGKRKTFDEGIVIDPVTGLTAELDVIFA